MNALVDDRDGSDGALAVRDARAVAAPAVAAPAAAAPAADDLTRDGGTGGVPSTDAGTTGAGTVDSPTAVAGTADAGTVHVRAVDAPTTAVDGPTTAVARHERALPVRPALTAAELRADFGAHFEAEYQRLVAQLYAITLNPREAHDVVQDAYSRAWRDWAEISRSPDPTAWIRRVAVSSTIRSWRRALSRVGIGRGPAVGEGADPRTGAVLAALARLPAAERRAVVLFHMAGASLAEIAAVERVETTTVQARLRRARDVVTEGMADVLPAVLAPPLAGDQAATDHPSGGQEEEHR